MENEKFYYEFIYGGKTFELSVPINTILDKDVKELAYRLINSNNIPIFFYDDLTNKLKEYAKQTKLSLEDKIGDSLLDINFDFDDSVDKISQKFILGHYGYGNSDVPSNDEIFADAYHELIHSPLYNNLLNMEKEHAVEMSRLIQRRDQALQNVRAICDQSMDMAIANIGVLYSDEQVNQLSKQHLEATELELSKWKSSVSSLKLEQKNDFRNQVMRLFEASKIQITSQEEIEEAKLMEKNNQDLDLPKKPPTPTTSKPRKSPSHRRKSTNFSKQPVFQKSTIREDSFTVHLGAQMKTTHNLRLLSCDICHLCDMPHNDSGQHFQTAISLYSDRLCGMVLLVDSRISFMSGVKKEFYNICEKSTDFHFADLAEQLEAIKLLVDKNQDEAKSKKSVEKLQVGEIYITKHSNLSQVHVVFHVVIDGSLLGDISSRHPVILAYRNVIKTAFKNDVKTLTIPLLLVHEMTEEMTEGWCLKRAELVLKCLKGFVMEMFATEGSFNLQLIVPPSLSDETFNNIAAMIPSIFRMSNPLIATS